MALNLVKTLLGLVFPLITFPYVTRILGPEGIGKVSYAQSIIGYFSFVSCFGMSTYAIREIAKVRDSREQVSKLSVELLIANLITTFIAYALFLVFLECSPSLSSYRPLLYICSLSMLFTTIGMDWLFIAEEDFLYITIRSVTIQICSLVLLFVIVKDSNDYLNYAILLVLSTVGANVFNLLYSKKYISLPKIRELHIFRHYKYLYILFITATLAGLHTVVDRSMLGYLVDDFTLGIYTTGSKISSIVISIICAVSIILFPRFSYLIRQGDENGWKTLLDRMIHFLLLVTLPFMVGLVVLKEQIILIICGDRYLPSVPVLMVMSFMVPVMCFTNLLGNLLFMSLNKERWTLYSVIIGAISNVILNFLFIPSNGATGAAISAVLSEAVVLTFQIILLGKIISIRQYFKVAAKYLGYSVIMGLFMFGAGCFVKSNIFVNTVVLTLLGIIAYTSLLLYEKNYIVYDAMFSVKRKLGNFIDKL